MDRMSVSISKIGFLLCQWRIIFSFFCLLLCYSPPVRRRLFYVNIRRIHIFVIMWLRAKARGEKEKRTRSESLRPKRRILFSWFWYLFRSSLENIRKRKKASKKSSTISPLIRDGFFSSCIDDVVFGSFEVCRRKKKRTEVTNTLNIHCQSTPYRID